jgi:nucleotide-binding universal stress UspA family protein
MNHRFNTIYEEKMFKKVLVAFDGSEGSLKTLKEAILLAKGSGAELHTISVEEVPPYPAKTREVEEEKEASDKKFAALIVQAKKMAEEHGITLGAHVEVGHAVQRSVEFIKDEQFDLLLVGFMGHSALYESVMGGTCQALVRLAPCAVLVAK